MTLDKKLLQSNLDGICDSPIIDKDVDKLLFALSKDGQYGIAALLAFTLSLRSQLIDMKDKYKIMVDEEK